MGQIEGDQGQGVDTGRALVPQPDNGWRGALAGLGRRSREIAKGATAVGENALSHAQKLANEIGQLSRDALEEAGERARTGIEELRERARSEFEARVELPGHILAEYRSELSKPNGLLSEAAADIAATVEAHRAFLPLDEFAWDIYTGARTIEPKRGILKRRQRQEQVSLLKASIREKVPQVIRDTEQTDLYHAAQDYYAIQTKYSPHQHGIRDITGAAGSALQAEGAKMTKGGESVSEAVAGVVISRVGKALQAFGERPRVIHADGSNGIDHVVVHDNYRNESAALIRDINSLLQVMEITDQEKSLLQSLISQDPREALARLLIRHDTATTGGTPRNVWQYARIRFYEGKTAELKSKQTPQIDEPTLPQEK